MPTLLDDFLSRDTSRVLHATWETIHSRDPETLCALGPHISQIRRATARLDLGGMFRPNGRNVEHALTKLERFQRGECWCANYPGMDVYDPTREEAAGHVRIDATSEPGWSMTYVSTCAVCGQVFDVEQGDSHYTWWRWVPRGRKRDGG